jgi:hypothetical protein
MNTGDSASLFKRGKKERKKKRKKERKRKRKTERMKERKKGRNKERKNIKKANSLIYGSRGIIVYLFTTLYFKEYCPIFVSILTSNY